MAAEKNKYVKVDRFSYLSRLSDDPNLESSDDEDIDQKTSVKSKRDISFLSKPTDSDEIIVGVSPDSKQSGCAKAPPVLDDKTKAVASDKAKRLLPSATEVLKTVAKPDFLEKKKTDVNWNKFVKNTLVPSTEVDVSLINTHQVPPPNTYDCQSKPLKLTMGDDSSHSNKRVAVVQGISLIIYINIISNSGICSRIGLLQKMWQL